MLIRLIYFGYYIKQLNWKLFSSFCHYVKLKYGVSYIKQLFGIFSGVFIYNISILEYYQFRFYEKTPAEKKKWAGTGYMYEYQRLMNPMGERQILDDKRLFYKYYRKFIIHETADSLELENDSKKIDLLLNNPSGKIVFKVSDGKCGAQVDINHVANFRAISIVSWMQKNGYDLAEEFIIQHRELNNLSPSAVNTIRIFTQLDHHNKVNILGCRLRISVNSKVDNMAAGNLAAPIDSSTGIVYGPGVYSDITKTDEDVHPVTGVAIVGFKIPYWDELLKMVKEAASLHPQNRSIGWDVVITEYGPGLIEGNHDWCKLLWQLPVKKGQKNILEKYKNDYLSNV